jgi:predicted ATP-grasp superfamily ATP-dependent carboligase
MIVSQPPRSTLARRASTIDEQHDSRSRAVRALIVEEGFSTGALSAARALARSGWSVGIGSPRARGMASSSRHVSARHLVPRPTDGLEAFVQGVNRAVRDGGYDIVFPAGDAELLALSVSRSRVDTLVPYPSHEVVFDALDKLSLAEAARAAGLASPETMEPTEENLGRLNEKVVVKARHHGMPGQQPTPARLEVAITSVHDEVRQAVAQMRSLGGKPLLQRFIRGTLLIYTGVVDGSGTVVASVQHVAERIWPPGAGFSCRAVTMPVDRDLEQQLATMLSSVGWVGLAQFQMIVPPGGQPHVIDFNGRFYASLESAMAAGVNFPVIWADLALYGRVPQTKVEGRPGVRYQWLEGDLSRAVRERRGGFAADVADCLRFAPSAHHAVWSRGDLAPTVRSLLHLAGTAGAKAVTALRDSFRPRGHG